MNRSFMKKFYLFLFAITVAFQTYAVEPVAKQDVEQLEIQMKSFKNRFSLYLKCIRKKCSDEERRAAAKTMLKDGWVLLSSLYMIAMGSFVVLALSEPDVWQPVVRSLKESLITIPVRSMRNSILGMGSGEQRTFFFDRQEWQVKSDKYTVSFTVELLPENAPKTTDPEFDIRIFLSTKFPTLCSLILSLQKSTNAEESDIRRISITITSQAKQGIYPYLRFELDASQDDDGIYYWAARGCNPRWGRGQLYDRPRRFSE